jgi:hypothetical protein
MYGTAEQTTADNIILRMRPAYSVTSAADTHSPHAMLLVTWQRSMQHYTYIAVGLKSQDFLS